ncbi:MAG TPA: nitroreductase family protein [Phycisphaerae bacterium]|nr:nitroreductase family protein [Phycisphaerae bacterium]
MITIDAAACTGCGACTAECPLGLFRAGEDGSVRLVPDARRQCIRCGHCVAVCGAEAVTIRRTGPGDCDPAQPPSAIPSEAVAGLFRSRRSIRAFRDEPVDRRTLEQILNLTRWSPTGVNRQTVQWTVVDGREHIHRLAALTVEWMRANGQYPMMIGPWERGQDMILRGAPHLAIAHDNDVGGTDCVIAVAALDLAASALGVGACWAGIFMGAARDVPAIAEALALPPGHTVHAALMLGYPKYTYRRIPPRRPLKLRWMGGDQP